jgi:hypothetical protein
MLNLVTAISERQNTPRGQGPSFFFYQNEAFGNDVILPNGCRPRFLSRKSLPLHLTVHLFLVFRKTST